MTGCSSHWGSAGLGAVGGAAVGVGNGSSAGWIIIILVILLTLFLLREFTSREINLVRSMIGWRPGMGLPQGSDKTFSMRSDRAREISHPFDD